MKPEISPCICGNICEVKIASGQKKPENKGKKYISCLKCNEFKWIEDDTPVAAKAPLTPQKPIETREVVREPIVDPKVWIDKDLRIARESALHSATRNHQGHEIDPALIVLEAEEYVKYIYQGVKAISPEDIEVDELPSEFLARKNKEEISNEFPATNGED